MAVSVVDSLQAYIQCASGERTVENFYNTFGTTGCLLSCNARREHQENYTKQAQPGSSNAVRFYKKKEMRRSLRDDTEHAFTLAELLASIESGCGSCKVLRSILEHVSLIDPNDHQTDANASFNVTRTFVLKKRRLVNNVLELQQIGLFSPLGYPEKFRTMPESSFLCGNTDSNTSMARASLWLDNCVQTHDNCRPNTHSRLPFRFIDVTEIYRKNTKGVKLISNSPGQLGKYACLSHCWGKVRINCCTTTETFKRATEFIGWNSMPQNFRDAINITRRLQLQYIWIDSICIIQNDRDDWAKESRKMADIYKNAYITIAAAASADSTGGCFTKTNPDISLSIVKDDTQSFLVGARMCDTLGFLERDEDIKKRRPLERRAWVYQERLLSPRILYCNYGELAFRCLEGDACECGRVSMAPHTLNSKLPKGRINANLLLAKAISIKSAAIHDYWSDLVSKYMLLNITEPSDILPAISGCAREVAEMTGDRYLAGNWKRSFARYLTWYIKDAEKLGRTKWTAPTWSWASVSPGQQVVFYAKLDLSHLSQLLDKYIDGIRCEPKSANNDMGELVRGTGSLKFKAELLPCYIRRFCYYNLRAMQDAGASGYHRLTYRLHQRAYRKTKVGASMTLCTAPVAGLDAHGGNFLLQPDVPLRDNVEWQAIGACVRCALARVWLLRAGQIIEGNKRQDYFILLKAVDMKTRTYERLGMSVFERQTVEERKQWFEDVWLKDVLPKEDITIN